MHDDVEDLLERASRVRTGPVDPDEIWRTGTKRRRTRRTLQAATATLVVVALATPVAITAYRELSTTRIDVADAPGGSQPRPSAPVTLEEPCGDAFADVEPGTVTRADAAGVTASTLAASDVELPSAPPDRFVDDDDTEHEDAINRLSAAGILLGTNRAPERFAPEDPLTRGQLASLLVRSYELSTGDRLDPAGGPFDDDDGTPHEIDNAKAAAADLMTAVGPGRFDPYAEVTRDELLGAAARLSGLLSGNAVGECTP